MQKPCIRCYGTGTYLGLGMMMTDCELCSEPSYEEPKPLEKVDRKSKSYKAAIKDIMAINPSMSREEAVRMFDKAYDKN
jgi:hypothetical protein